jgi:ribonuclease Z
LIEENKQLQISTFSLNHRIPCFGYLFQEKPKDRKLLSSAIQKYNIPIQFRGRIKQGMDYVQEDGHVIPNNLLTEDAEVPISYAYCSDNRVKENQLDFLQNTNYLYHEATFTQELLDRAKSTMHSTAFEAASLAKKLNVDKLLLGHFSARYTDVSPIVKEAKSVFTNSIALKDGMEIIF